MIEITDRNLWRYLGYGYKEADAEKFVAYLKANGWTLGKDSEESEYLTVRDAEGNEMSEEICNEVRHALGIIVTMYRGWGMFRWPEEFDE